MKENTTANEVKKRRQPIAVLLAAAEAAYLRRICGGLTGGHIVETLGQLRLELRRMRAAT